MPQEIYNDIFGYFDKIGLNLNTDFTNEHLKEVIVRIRKLDHLKFNLNIIDTRLIEKYSLLKKVDTDLINNSFSNLHINLDNKLSFEKAEVVSSVYPKIYFKAVVISAFRG
jgi:predicted transcriptional regulator